MASYPAIIELRVDGITQVTRVLDTIEKLDRALVSIKKTPLAIDSGNATDGIRVLKKEVDEFVIKLGQGKTQLASTTAGLQAQAAAFRNLAANVKIGSQAFNLYTQAAEQARQKITLKGGLAEIKALTDAYKVGRTASTQSFKGVEELIKFGAQIPKNTASLNLYKAELEQVLTLVNFGTKDYNQLEAAIAGVNEQLRKGQGLGAMQGRTSPIRGGVNMPGSPLAKEAARNKTLQNVAIGGAFPMLFGAGPGAVLGGAAGGFIPGSPMMSVVTSALGAVVDEFGAAAIAMGASLREPIANFEKLKEANIFASKSQEFYIQKLIETGRIAEATGQIQAQVIKKVGVSGYNDLSALGAASSGVSKAFADFTLQAQAAVAGPLTGLLLFIKEVLKLAQAPAQLQAARLDPAAFSKAQSIAASKASKFGIVGDIQLYEKELNRLSADIVAKNIATITPKNVILSPEEREQAIKAAEQVADTIKGAYRTGFQLQQQSHDLQRQGADLQRRVADEIFNKQQQIARLEIDTARQKQQVAIDTVDLEYRRRISNEEGRLAQVLAAEADLMKVKAEGEADIAAKKLTLDLNIAKQQRDTANSIFALSRDADNLRRATLNYEMQVADYRLDIERKIAAERRVEDAAETITGGKSGVTATSVAGFPITSRQGMRTHPVTGEMKMHAGTDIGTPMNTALAYSMGGVVKEATTMGGYGKILEVELDNGITVFAAHLNKVLVKIGERFSADQLLARTGQTGVGTGPHLHMESKRGGDSTAGLPFLVLDGKASKIAPSASTTAGQFATAGSQVPSRPTVPQVGVSAAAQTLTGLDAQAAALQKEGLNIAKQQNKVANETAMLRLQEVARGALELQQRKDALAFSRADLAVVGAGNTELQDRLAFEAQSLVKLQLQKDEDDKILKTTQLTGKEKSDLVASLVEGIRITEQQIELDREALLLAQEKRFEVEKTNIANQIAQTGGGLRAGFIGPAGQAFEKEMATSGNQARATELANLTNRLTLAQVQAQGMENSVLAIGDAFGTAMTAGVASLINGTATAAEVFAQFLDTIAKALLDAAAQMIATYIAIGIARIFAGIAASGGSTPIPGAAPQMTPGAIVTPTGFSGQFAGMAANGATFSNGIAKFARGGIVNSPTMFQFAKGGSMATGVMGEAGPEAIMPLKRGADGKLGVAGGGGGSVNVVVNVDASGSSVQGDEPNANQLGRVISVAVQAELVKQQRPGGLLSGTR